MALAEHWIYEVADPDHNNEDDDITSIARLILAQRREATEKEREECVKACASVKQEFRTSDGRFYQPTPESRGAAECERRIRERGRT